MYAERLRSTVPDVRERIARAAERAGRSAADVSLVAVTKGHPLAAVEAAVEAGLRDLGESRVFELEEKVGEAGRDAARWHLIGHVQRRKVPTALGLFDLLHSLDSLRLARRFQRIAEREDTASVPALVQVNTSGEEAKYGLAPDEAVVAVEEMAGLDWIRLVGLMTMAPLTDDEAVLRGTFSDARELFEACGSVDGFEARHLSMGMTNDYEIAVEEGSTMVRLGTALFGERPR